MHGYMAVMHDGLNLIDECAETLEEFLIYFCKQSSCSHQKAVEIICKSEQMEKVELVEFVNSLLPNHEKIENIIKIAEVVF